MRAIAESALARNFRNVGEGGVDRCSRYIPQLKFPHARCIDHQSSGWSDQQLTMAGGVPPFADGVTDRGRELSRFAQNQIDQRRLPDS